ncbi:hypothetical protein H8E77_32965 [bacterium]|nr:hypothetical protein [bacterium]
MKKLILAGIVIIICCLVFLIVKQNSSRADIGMDIYAKTYPVPFGDWVYVYIKVTFQIYLTNHCSVLVSVKEIEGKTRYVITGFYTDNEWGREMYRTQLSKIEERVKLYCRAWTAEGYPISLNDFEFDIQAIQ